jgi:predicted RNA polymerase sigma factor
VLVEYPYLAAARADVLCRLGRTRSAAAAFREAALHMSNTAEATFLNVRADRVETESEASFQPLRRTESEGAQENGIRR